MNPLPANNTWQGKRNAECWVVIADRNHGSLIAQYHLSDSRGDHPDAVLAGPNTLNDRDVSVTALPFELLPHRLRRWAFPKEVQYLPATSLAPMTTGTLMRHHVHVRPAPPRPMH